MSGGEKFVLMRNLISCSIEMERLVAKIYGKLAKRLPPMEALAARHIARESSNHAVFLEEVLRLLGVEKSDVDCSKVVGEVFNKIYYLIEHIDEIDLNKIRDQLESIESELGEETYHYTMFPLIKDIFKDNINLLNIIVDEIICEEKYHNELVSELSSTLSRGHKQKPEGRQREEGAPES